jgi:hypothetical protein
MSNRTNHPLICKGVIAIVASTLNAAKMLAQYGGDIPQNVNFAIKIDSIQKFLAASKINLSTPTDTNPVESFDEAQKCLALVRTGDVTEEELKQPALVCVYRYASLFDLWYRFRVIEIEFYDFKKSDSIFKVGQSFFI